MNYRCKQRILINRRKLFSLFFTFPDFLLKKKMSNSSVYFNILRSRSNKPVLLGLLSGIFLSLLFLAVIRDLNSKLEVMTSSNAQYQRMTDRQSEKIRKLESEKDSLASSSSRQKSEWKAEEEKWSKRFSACQKEFRAVSGQIESQKEEEI